MIVARQWLCWTVSALCAGCATVDRQVAVSGFASAGQNRLLSRSVAEARALSLARQLSLVDGVRLTVHRGRAGVAVVVHDPEGGFGDIKAVVEPFRDGWRATAVAQRTPATVAAMEQLLVREVTATAAAESAATAATLARMRALRELALAAISGPQEGKAGGPATVLRIEYEFRDEFVSVADGRLEQPLHRAYVTLWGTARLAHAGGLSAEEQVNLAEMVAMEHATAWEWDKALPAIEAVLAARPRQVAYGLLKVTGLIALAKKQAAGVALDAAVAAARATGADEAGELRRAQARVREVIGDGAGGLLAAVLASMPQASGGRPAASAPSSTSHDTAPETSTSSERPPDAASAGPTPASTAVPPTAGEPAATKVIRPALESDPEPAKEPRRGAKGKRKRGRKR